ncbi:MAG: helix-turn-helix transcriptional regulator [Cellulomonadaceae bacterium]
MAQPDVVPLREGESSTRERVLALIVGDGPIRAAELADRLDLTAAAIRRHIASLTEDGLVAVHDAGHTGLRGRPARRYVATETAQDAMAADYSDLAVQAMQYLHEIGGADAVEEFATSRLREVERRYADRITARDTPGRVAQLAALLEEDGYAASARPVPGTAMIQLCQGHCPVQHVAARFPELCEAEVQTFSRLLGSHVQRLVTLAGGAHVCTTNVPVGRAPTRPSDP